MLLRLWTSVLLWMILNGQNWVLTDHIDQLSFDDKNEILSTIGQSVDIGQDLLGRISYDQGNINHADLHPFHHSNLYNIDHHLAFGTCNSKSNRNYTDMTVNCSSSISNTLDSYFETMVEHLNKDLDLGQVLEFDTKNVSLTFEKVSLNNISGKRLIQSSGTEIRFPALDFNETATISLMTLPSSSIVSLSLHNQSGKILSIKNTTNPFEIRIPQQRNQLMPSMIRQNVQSSAKPMKFNYHHVNLTHHSNFSLALHIDLEPANVNLSYLLILRFSDVPDIQSNLIDERKLLCPKDREDHSSMYKIFINNTRISHHQWAMIGIREMKECLDDNDYDPIQFSSDYSIRIYSSVCSYLDENNHWQSDGLTVGPKTNERFIQCYSTHLTTFAGGFLVLPNPISFNQPFDFLNNITIYITLIVLALLFIATMAFSYYRDRIDARMLMVIPLADNNQLDTYLYQLVVFTGMRANAGTTSKVHFVLSGSDNETSIRTLSAERRILARGSTDSFIMAVPRSLGHLNYLRIWHDNSGFDADASWYLKYFLIRDLQTMETTYFICENWLAVEKGSGEIDRTIGAAGELDKMELKHLLSKNAYRSMADNHLWFSIFAYHIPSANRFTRIQRCTCCFVLFFMSILLNVLYFDVNQDIEAQKLNEHGFIIGPFHISPKEISISIITELIVFFPSLILVALFRRSKPRRTRMVSPVGEAIENIRSKKHPTGNPSKKEKRFLLPWWCLIIAYVLSFLIVATSVFFILITCVKYGDDQTRVWLGTMLSNFFASILLLQPLKVLLLALLFMCLCRKKSQNDAFIEHEDPLEDFTVSRQDPHKKFPPKSLLAKTRLDPYRTRREKIALKKFRALRLKEVKAWFILRELFLILLFLGVLYAITFANHDVSNARRIVKYLRGEFLEIHQGGPLQGHEKTGEKTGYIFDHIRTMDDYWKWLENIFVHRYLEINWRTAKKGDRELGVYDIIGIPILRQLRVKNDSCPRKALHDQMTIDDCNLPYRWYNEAKEPFGWNVTVEDRTNPSSAFRYTPAEDKTLIYSTAHATYMAGGYILEMQAMNEKLIISRLRYLQEHRWIDRHTRAIFLTYGLYNFNTNLFVHCSLLLERLPITGELIPRSSFQPFKLTELYTGTDLIYCLIYVALILYYMYVEIKLIFQMKKNYLKQFWSYIQWGIVFCSWFAVVIHVLRQDEIKRMQESLKKNRLKRMVSLQFFAYLHSLLTYLLGFCCFFGTLKVLRLLRFNRRLSLLHLTLKKSARQILGFLLMFSIVFVAFTTLYYLLFHPFVISYSTWPQSALTCFEMVSLHFTTVPDLKRIDPLIAGLCLFLFIFLAVYLLSNMFVSIIVDNFNLIRREQMKQANEVELIQFTIEKIKQWMGIRSRQRAAEKKKNPVLAFPDKMDELMVAIDKLHRGGNQ